MNLLLENIVNLSAVSTDHIHLPVTINHNIALDILRLDKIHPVISGNKWFKLKYYLEEALQNRQNRVVTFGGAYSNHIIATACAASKAGLKSVGIIRGERPAVLSLTLSAATQLGMELKFVSRETYNQKKNPAFIKQLQREYHNPCIIPEGGEGYTGIKGAAEIAKLAGTENYTHLVCAVGTGTLLSGLAVSAVKQQQVIGIAVLKGFNDWRSAYIAKKEQQRISIITDYHFGGYAKKDSALLEFMNEWYNETNIPSDFVYTGKLFFAVCDLIKKGYFPKTSRLLVIHSGGLQGNKSLPLKTLVF
ncbi:MAG: pyridoxal-phosphate dependent enzyme [Chitinophagaceae bacterium]